jgi:uncharacterized protein YggE
MPPRTSVGFGYRFVPLLAAALLIASPAAAQFIAEAPDTASIAAPGTGEVMVPPDRAVVYLVVAGRPVAGEPIRFEAVEASAARDRLI